MADQGYARPEMLTTTEWLAAHLQDANLRIVDCDNRDAYRRAHIPGAITFRGHHYLKEEEGALHLMGLEQFAETMGALGIGDDTLVIAYDSFSGLYATRFWWALHYYGHTQAKVLNGGWDKWLAEGRPPAPMLVARSAAVASPVPCISNGLTTSIAKPRNSNRQPSCAQCSIRWESNLSEKSSRIDRVASVRRTDCSLCGSWVLTRCATMTLLGPNGATVKICRWKNSRRA